MGRRHPWLRGPGQWADISRLAINGGTPFSDLHVDPSQGSHFFQNIVSFGIGYLTIDPRDNQDRLDTEWLDGCQAETDSPSLRHISFGEPLRIALNGRTNVGVVLKPE